MTNIDHDLQREILSKSRFWENGARYSQLMIEGVENDLFNYHLQQLVKNGFLNKKQSCYLLTARGKALVTNIDEQDKQNPPSFKVSVYMCAVVVGKVLLYRRRKHPQYGYVGLPSGKIKFGENFLQTASREFMEETNLQAEFVPLGNMRQIRRNEESVTHEDGIFYVCYTNEVEGELIADAMEGEFFWHDLHAVNEVDKLFRPSVEIIIKEITKRLSGDINWQTQFVYELEPEPEEY